MGLILLVILILLLLGVLPSWQHARGWGPYPAGIIVTLLVVLLILWLLGVVPSGRFW